MRHSNLSARKKLLLHRSSRSLLIQQLEKREVFNATSVFENGVVTIQADDLPNEILVSADIPANKLSIRVDAMVFTYRNEAVKHLQINAKGGDDSIVVMANVRQTTRLDGGSGRDRISGSAQNDVILGGDGDDRILGNGGDDRIEGGPGNDRIAGGDGSDNIQGGRGNDLIRGGGGNDELFGESAVEQEEPDSDEVLSWSSALERTAELRKASNVVLLNAPNVEQANPIPETQSNDVIYGDEGDDIILAGIGNDVVFGGNGRDSINGGSGIDFIEGQDGDDRLSGGSGVDVVFGGAGDDQIGGGRGDDFLFGGAGNDEIDGGAGDDWLFGDGTNTYPEGYTSPMQYALEFAGINFGNDVMRGGDGNDILFAGNGNDRLYGGNGNDRLEGGQGDDALFGEAGRDTLYGGDGNDLLNGGAGNDFMSGGGGINEIQARDGQEDTILTGGLDKLFVDEFDKVLFS